MRSKDDIIKTNHPFYDDLLIGETSEYKFKLSDVKILMDENAKEVACDFDRWKALNSWGLAGITTRSGELYYVKHHNNGEIEYCNTTA